MAHLIDKDALLAEIESLKDSVPYFPTIAEKEAYREGVYGACCKIYSLEVKEVDLNGYYYEFLQKEWFGNSHVRTVSEMMAFTAKHFFELGVSVSNKVKKGE